MNQITRRALAILAVLSVLITAGGAAHANVVVAFGCTVNDVGVDVQTGNRIFSNCDGTLFNAYQSAPGLTCAPQSAATLQVFMLMLLAAYITGKPLNITYEDGNGIGQLGCNGIYAIDLFN